jgi:arginyl-tRNA synthetase
MEQYLEEVIQKALAEMGAPTDTAVKFEIPQNASHGDLSTNVAMTLAKPLKRSPRDLAQDLISRIPKEPSRIEAIEIAGPGFINIKFSGEYLAEELRTILKQPESYGRSTLKKGQTANIEWVSANPTGQLHAGHGRNVCVGAAIANLLEWIGYSVVREYYFNNAGKQVQNLAKSVRARYLQALGDNIDFPEDGYHGAEILDIAQAIKSEYGESKRDADLAFFEGFGIEQNFAKIKESLARLNVVHDIFFNENSLYESGVVKDTIAEFKSKGLAYEKDGAVWLKLSEMGEKDDRVIVKSSGEPTYRLPDICYHRDKLSRGYDLVVDIFGADHIATIPDVLAAIRALGLDTSRVKVVIYQMVSFISGGELIKFSKRSGGNYLLEELLDDVGTDAAKFFFNMRANGSHLEFDVELAKEQSDKNPVYYVQYAHARIASILRFARQQGIEFESNKASLEALQHPEELALIKTLMKFPAVVRMSAQSFSPHHICEYLREVAAQFHKFYHDCRIVGAVEPLQTARLSLAVATRHVLFNGCAILGVSAPDSM